MPRPLTNRSLDALKFKVPQLRDHPQAFARLLESRNNGSSQRLHIRDLHEEAISELLRKLDQGTNVPFLPTPSEGYVYRTILIDRSLRERATAAASQHHIRLSTLIFTAFAQYLENRGLLQAA